MNFFYYFFQIVNSNRHLFGFVFIVSISVNVFAEENELIQNQFDDQWVMATDAELDSLRGGFTLANGVIIDFGFQKQVFQNGVETFSSHFSLPKNVPLLQRETFNFSIDQANGLLSTVIQNKLDNQVIKTINTIKIDISNFKNFNLDLGGARTFRNLIAPSFNSQ